MAIAAIPEEIRRHIDAVLVLSRQEILLKLLDEADNCLELEHLVAATVLARVAAEGVYSFKACRFPLNNETISRYYIDFTSDLLIQPQHQQILRR